MRSLSVAAILVVGYVQSAVAGNSTPELDNPATPVVAPNLEFLSQQQKNLVPNLESLSEEPDNPAMQTLKSLAPELENPPR